MTDRVRRANAVGIFVLRRLRHTLVDAFCTERSMRCISKAETFPEGKDEHGTDDGKGDEYESDDGGAGGDYPERD